MHLFCYTLVILLVSIFASALCFSTFVVSRKQVMLYACLGFLCYFFDVALVFKDDYLLRSSVESLEMVYFIGSPLLSILTGAGILTAFWMIVCHIFAKGDGLLAAFPAFAFTAGSMLVYAVLPAGPIRQFCFYSMRGAVLFAILIAAAVWYARRDPSGRELLWKHRGVYACMWVMGGAVVAENVVVMFLFDPSFVHSGALQFFPERNFAENLLMVLCALFAAKGCWRTLSLHFNTPPCNDGAKMAVFIEDGLASYKAHYGLSNREADVLRLLLQGKDNQNIASEMNLAVGTVKIHVHNILKKCGQANRQDLMRDFRMH